MAVSVYHATQFSVRSAYFFTPLYLPTWYSGVTHSEPASSHRLHDCLSLTRMHFILLRRHGRHAACFLEASVESLLEGDASISWHGIGDVEIHAVIRCLESWSHHTKYALSATIPFTTKLLDRPANEDPRPLHGSLRKRVIMVACCYVTRTPKKRGPKPSGSDSIVRFDLGRRIQRCGTSRRL